MLRIRIQLIEEDGSGPYNWASAQAIVSSSRADELVEVIHRVARAAMLALGYQPETVEDAWSAEEE